MKRLAQVTALCFLLAGVGLFSGCGQSNDTATKYTVIFSQCNNAEPYRAEQNRLMEELFAGDDEVSLSVLDGQADAAKQISQIENAIRLKPDLLIVAPLQRDALTKVMGEAVEAGIPTICLERDIAEPNYTTFIRCDNVAIGRMAGQFIVDKLTEKYGEPKGNMVEIQGMNGVKAANDRHDGAHEVLSKYPNIKVVHDATGNWMQGEAISRMEEALNANPEGIDVVYGHNDPMAYGAYLAAKEKGREKDILFVGIDGLAHEGVKYVEAGVFGATFEYPLCVDKAVEIGTKILKDPTFKPEKTYLMDSRMITASSAEEE